MVYNISALGGQVSVLEYPDPIVWWQLVLVLLGCFGGAFTTGAVGLGGVIWVPMLLLLPDVPADVAIGTVFVGAVLSTWLDLARWAMAGHVRWDTAVPLMFCVAPASFLGGLVVRHVPGAALSVGVAAIALYSGLSQLRLQWMNWKARPPQPPPPPLQPPPQPANPQPLVSASPEGTPRSLVEVKIEKGSGAAGGAQGVAQGEAAGAGAALGSGSDAGSPRRLVSPDASNGIPEAPPDPPAPSPPPMPPPPAAAPAAGPETVPAEELHFVGTRGRALVGCVGAVAGFASSLTGTGGPLLFLPVVFALRPHMKQHAVLGTAKAYVFALVHAAAAGAFTFGHADVGLAGILSGVLAVGVVIGARVAIYISPVRLKIATAIALLVIGVKILTRAIMKLV